MQGGEDMMKSFSRLACEILEDRCQPAGIVMTNLVGTTLTITGDDLANQINVFLEGDTVNIVGKELTVVIGGTSFSGVSQIDVQLAGRNDEVEFVGAFDGDITVQDSWGKDKVKLKGNYAGSVNVDLGVGGDRFEVDRGTFSGAIQVELGLGNDQVKLRRASFAAAVNIDAASGRDHLELEKIHFLVPSVVDGGDDGGFVKKWKQVSGPIAVMHFT
jgi:hypothetical protein